MCVHHSSSNITWAKQLFMALLSRLFGSCLFDWVCNMIIVSHDQWGRVMSTRQLSKVPWVSSLVWDNNGQTCNHDCTGSICEIKFKLISYIIHSLDLYSHTVTYNLHIIKGPCMHLQVTKFSFSNSSHCSDWWLHSQQHYHIWGLSSPWNSDHLSLLGCWSTLWNTTQLHLDLSKWTMWSRRVQW